ncbi:DUF3630 family protein [Noviherbaspirillum saxi]|uniref:DUF3630 family protein n=1 Tax=Noviherbaspirillum saxi TaxID=2320863 RepID=A0A3A3FPR8_9BURK|nr:DUF3630 family protein [Noviherbaspirillum saxi]RJF95689.1 DUF3630 family protein [Noviherbaspirillum saxi]
MNNIRLLQTPERLELQISDDSAWGLFDEIASVLQREFSGSWGEQVDGIDQRYWDLKIEKVTLTLHLEHYSGITLFPSSAELDKVASGILLEKAHRFLTSYDPAV